MTDRVFKIIKAYETSRDPFELAREMGFRDHRELGLFMREQGYIWDSKEKNYFRMDEREEYYSRYFFEDKNSLSNPSKNPVSREFNKIDIDEYYSLPLFLNKEIYKTLILYVRENDLDYNRLIEDALKIYFS